MSEIIKDVAKALHPKTTRAEEIASVSNNQELTTKFNQEQVEHAERSTIRLEEMTNGTRDEIKSLFITAPQNFLKKLGKRITRLTLKPAPYLYLKAKGKLIDFPIKTAIAGILAAVTKVLNWADIPAIKVNEVSNKITGDNLSGGPAAANNDMEAPEAKAA